MIFPLIGNKRIEDVTKSFITGGHFPHAILIEGEAGLGKRTLAGYLAAAAACTGDNPPCDNCRSCHLYKVGSHPDISFTRPEDKKKSVSVDQIRELRDAAYIKPQLNGRRVMVIEQAHTLNANSQNALLKVLEEPPGATVFILLADNKASLLPTVLSRCVILSLAPPERQEAKAYLKSHTKAEEEKIDNVLLAVRGNIGRALAQLKKKKLSKGYTAAKEYITAFMEKREAIEFLRITHPLEKERVSADEFTRELKIFIAENLKKNCAQPSLCARLVKLDELINEMAPLLITNINLSLFFSAFVSKTKEIG